MTRPKIKIPWEPLDWLLEGIGAIAAIVVLLYPLYHFGSLPEEIPNHFDASGRVDGYGHKSTILFLPLIALATYVILWFLNKGPHRFNYTVQITEENAFRQYQLGTRLLRVTNVLMIVFFAYLVYNIIQGAKTGAQQINNIVMYIFLASLVLLPLGYLILNWKKHKP